MKGRNDERIKSLIKRIDMIKGKEVMSMGKRIRRKTCECG